ncbi:MAG: phage terminase large subunit [Oscillospiraceae bacterium]|nr:phage terminase large subunit [Oscillospiraceae bacterium]
MANVTINYQPTPKQAMFHASKANEILYGGAAGGGKTKALIMDALFRCLQNPGTTAAVFRRSYRELEDTDIKEAQASYPEALATYNAGRHEFVLVNGSKILFRHCENESDRFKYSGLEAQRMYFDELTSFEQVVYDFIKTRLRAKKSLGVVPIVRSASNPGNIGHGWVKKMFVDAGPYLSIQEQEIFSETLHKSKKIRTQYIPALAMENPYITDDYIFELESKPPALRAALLNGDWDSFEGQVFKEFVNDPEHYADRKWTHVIEPFKIPETWPRFFGFDHGYSRPFSCGWYAMEPGTDCLIRYKEWYGCKPRQANIGIELTPVQIADGILEREEQEIKDNVRILRVADPAIFDKSRGDSVADQMSPGYMGRRQGVLFNRGDHARIPGKMQVHERLRFGADGLPKLQVFNTCKEFIRTVPTLPYSQKKPEDIDSDAEDHIYDELRYVCMDHPVVPAKKPPREYKPFSPFDED